LNALPEVKSFLRRPGGLDQYPSVQLEWLFGHKPELRAFDKAGGEHTVDLSPLNQEQLHQLLNEHFDRVPVAPPSFLVRSWRRFFGWAYGLPTELAALCFIVAVIALLVVCYPICCKYTAICDSLSDL